MARKEETDAPFDRWLGDHHYIDPVYCFLNLNLIFALRKKHHDGDWVDKIQKANRTAVDPWKDENESFERLSKKVEEIQSKAPPSDKKPIK